MTENLGPKIWRTSWFHRCPVQPGWPQEQTISILLAIPSQWALQYFDPSEGVQLHAAFAHFLELAMVLLYRPVRRNRGHFRLRHLMREGQGKVPGRGSIGLISISPGLKI